MLISETLKYEIAFVILNLLKKDSIITAQHLWSLAVCQKSTCPNRIGKKQEKVTIKEMMLQMQRE